MVLTCTFKLMARRTNSYILSFYFYQSLFRGCVFEIVKTSVSNISESSFHIRSIVTLSSSFFLSFELFK